jgi:hypothetical protein
MECLQRFLRQSHQLRLHSPTRFFGSFAVTIATEFGRDSPLENARESVAAIGVTVTPVIANRVPGRQLANVGSAPTALQRDRL